MLRNALPKPQRQSLPERAAAAHSSRQRPVPSAKQRMQPPTGVQQRKKVRGLQLGGGVGECQGSPGMVPSAKQRMQPPTGVQQHKKVRGLQLQGGCARGHTL